ncbi:endonuclease/exonuclease/phosphatase family protein [Vibrio ponticus]|nr:endonuclease/exonuclease/phosphatase family protein [Vibrio ponticus]
MNNINQLTFASCNLFNFIEPPNAFYDFENIYETEGWQAKCQWTKQQVEALNADIVGIQEVFSIEAAKALFAELGFHHFVTVDHPSVESDYIYSQPVVALASKYPIAQFGAVTPPSEITEHYATTLPSFSRKPIFAVIAVPELGNIAMYVCHLKSQRAADSLTGENPYPLVGQWLSSQQRGWEALMLRVFMEQQYHKSPMPTVLVGDMNQSLTTHITNLLVQNSDTSLSSLSLKDSWEIFCTNQPEEERKPTHYHFAKGNVLDYILLSAEFDSSSPYSLADIERYQVIDQHLINPNYERDKYASDHAFIAVTTRFIL